jgi:hypothetical protein
MQFQVPQFTEVEDKIFGPLTLKQFIFCLGGAAIAFIFWSILPHWLAVIFIAPSSGLLIALAFVKMNEKPLLEVIVNAINYSLGTRIYTWQREEKKRPIEQQDFLPQKTAAPMPTLTEGKLKELAWSLDIHKKVR